MKKLSLLTVAFLPGASGYCCVSCNRDIRQAIFDSIFYPNLLIMLSAFIVLAVIIAVLTRYLPGNIMRGLRLILILRSLPLTSAAAVPGIGIGGFADGIVLHQVLQ